jgi:hypothetical protein
MLAPTMSDQPAATTHRTRLATTPMTVEQAATVLLAWQS